MEFTKMQGLGNDFVVLDGPMELDHATVQRLCDRRYGIGADGVLVVTPGNPLAMGYWNADGSAAEMCGNGLRCVARYAVDRGLVSAERFVVATPSGERTVMVGDHDVTVELGPIRLEGEVEIEGRSYHLVDVGNPHAVTVVEDPAEADVQGIGPRVDADPRFPDGTNVEFVAVTPEGVDVRIWERGVGETLACGTGMAAAVAAAAGMGGAEGGVPVRAPGGTGHVEILDGVAWLTGPAEYSFRGSV
jgi:diaminopimelate epimerase